MALPRHVVLIMRIINIIIINMDDMRPDGPNKGLILKLYKILK